MTCLALLEKDLSRDQEPWNTYAGEAYVAKPDARRTPLDGGMEKMETCGLLGRFASIYLHRLYHTLGKIYTENKKIFIFFVFFLTFTAKSPMAAPRLSFLCGESLCGFGISAGQKPIAGLGVIT